MQPKELITSSLEKALQTLGISDVKVEVTNLQDANHGDYATNVAMVLFRNKELGIRNYAKSPMELAEKIIEILNTLYLIPNTCSRIEAAPPGFINFWLSKDYLGSNLERVLEEREKIAKKGQGKKIMLEFADPNPFKEFHIGHLRNITLGESYARLLEARENTVWRVNYEGDVGMHVAKALFGMMSLSNQLPEDASSLSEKAAFLGKAYTAGAKAYEEDHEAKEKIIAINKKVYQKDPGVMPLWKKGREWSLLHFEIIYKRLGTIYKRYYFESEVAEKGKEIVLSHVDDGIFERHDGAVVYRGEKEGLHTRVFVTKEGYATYEAKDMALAPIKYQDFPYDLSIIITAHEQGPYFQVVFKALKKISSDLAAKTIHHSFGFVRLKDAKMSSRIGNVITGEWLLDEAKKRLKEVFSEMSDDVLEIVAVGAVKYSMLKFSRESDIAFSFAESISLEGNSGPYVQYAFARTRSVLAKVKTPADAKAKAGRQNSKVKTELDAIRLTLNAEELLLLRLLAKFDDTVEAAAKNFAPNLLCNYLYELASSFNLFYQKHRIVESDNAEFRLALTKAVGKTLQEGLRLLGIQAPEKM